MKITLDTNCLIYLFDENHETAINVEEVERIITHVFEGPITLFITTRSFSDILGDKDKERLDILLKCFELIPTIPAFNGENEEAYKSLYEEIKLILFPQLDEGDKRYKNKHNDILHLVSHKIHGRDVFVTQDKNFLKKKNNLEKIGIHIKSIKETLNYISQVFFVLEPGQRDHDKKLYDKFLEELPYSVIEYIDETDMAGVFFIDQFDKLSGFATSWQNPVNNFIHPKLNELLKILLTEIVSQRYMIARNTFRRNDSGKQEVPPEWRERDRGKFEEVTSQLNASSGKIVKIYNELTILGLKLLN